MRPVHAIRIFIVTLGVTLGVSSGLIACAGHPSDKAAAPTSAAPADTASATQDITCRFPQRQCFDCGGSQICALHCPECAPPAAPSPDVFELADLKPVGEACGGIICAPSLHCCNPTCSLCTPKGVQCTQQTCN